MTNPMDLAGMTEEDKEDTLVAMFQWIQQNGGILPYKAFIARLNTWPRPFVELLHISKSKKGYQVLLQPRLDSDPSLLVNGPQLE